MGRMQREKGKRIERFFSKLLNKLFPGIAARRSQQFCGAAGDDDLMTTLPSLFFESKGVEALSVHPAMEKAQEEAGENRVPVLLWKKNRKRPLFVCYLEQLPAVVEALHPLVPKEVHESSDRERPLPTLP